MKTKTLFASALAVLGLTACEKGLVDEAAVSTTGQVGNSVLQVRTRGASGDEARVAYPVAVYVFQGDECKGVPTKAQMDAFAAARNDVTPAPAAVHYLYKNNNSVYYQYNLATGTTGSANYITGINLRPVAIVSITKD